jgi:hypothetical protein
MARSGRSKLALVQRLANRLLRPLDLGVYRQSVYDALLLGDISHTPVALPDDARATLVDDNPRLEELRRRYQSHPAAKVSSWSDAHLRGKIELAYFRGDNQFIFQARGTEGAAYALTSFYLRQHDPLGLLDCFDEDGAFGALTHVVDGKIVSRDLLDSALEINYMAARLGAERLAKARVLDIGAGYGRLGHRLGQWSGDVQYLAADAVPLSTFLCEYYIGYRGTAGARVIPLDEVEATLASEGIDVAVNVHSFAEAPRDSVVWWIEQIAAAEVPYLLIVHGSEELFTEERSLTRGHYDEALRALGYEREDLQPKYAASETVQRYGVYPAWYHWFARR